MSALSEEIAKLEERIDTLAKQRDALDLVAKRRLETIARQRDQLAACWTKEKLLEAGIIVGGGEGVCVSCGKDTALIILHTGPQCVPCLKAP